MRTEAIDYTIDGKDYRGALIWDETIKEKRPAVLMAPNWLGVTDKALERGALLATNGKYVVFVADMYGAHTRPTGFADAPSFADPLRADAPQARQRIKAAYDVLLAEGGKRGIIDTSRCAAIGFCFGGGNVLDLARQGADVQAVVSIHGDLMTPMPAAPGGIKAAVLAVHGAADVVSPKAQRDAFEAEMEASCGKWQMVLYGSGVLHAYTDMGSDVPGIAKWDEQVARQTYDRTYAFIADAFAGKL